MMLQIIPDEDERAGGYGFVVMPAEGLDPARPVTVEILETFGGRWLGRSTRDGTTTSIGDPNWQSLPHEFGPYEVRIQDGLARVRIGPEIINKLPEYTHCRVKVGTVSAELIWPDTLIPRAGASALGGIRTISRPQPAELAPEPQARPPTSGPAPVTEEAEPTAPVAGIGKRGLYLALSAVLVLLAIAGGWVILSRDDQGEAPELAAAPPAPAPEAPEPEPEPELVTQAAADAAPPAADACGRAALTEGTAGFAGVYERLARCAEQIPPDQVFDLLETARTANDGAALRLLGNLYDPAIEDPLLETAFGLAAPANLALAVEYYNQAKAQGDAVAAVALNAACVALAEDSSTIAKGAHDDFCR
jgi:hypothetical protein